MNPSGFADGRGPKKLSVKKFPIAHNIPYISIYIYIHIYHNTPVLCPSTWHLKGCGCAPRTSSVAGNGEVPLAWFGNATWMAHNLHRKWHRLKPPDEFNRMIMAVRHRDQQKRGRKK